MCKNVRSAEESMNNFSVVMEDLAARFILTCPNEEFQSFERIFFQIEAAHWFYIDNLVENDPTLPKMGMKEFARKLFQHCPMLMKFQASVEAHLQKFSQYKVCVPVYGGIILNPEMDKCLLVKGWSKNATWGFPKGKINKDEAEIACAVREVFEEVGFDATNFVHEQDVITATINNNDREQSIKLYVIPGVSEDTVFETQTKKEISKIEWFPVKDLPTTKSPGNEFFLVRPFVRQLQEWIKCRKTGKPRSLKHGASTVSPATKPSKDAGRRTASVPAQRPTPECEVGARSHSDPPLHGLGRGGSFSVEDMFRVNEERFGVKSTYQFELYTTPLKSASAGNSPKAQAASPTTTDESIPILEAMAPGGHYRECTVPDVARPATSVQNLSKPAKKAADGGGSRSDTAAHRSSSPSTHSSDPQNKATASHKPAQQQEGKAGEGRRRKGSDEQSPCVVRVLKRPPQEQEAPSGGANHHHVRVCTEIGNVEFGKGFRFNMNEVMEPIRAMG